MICNKRKKLLPLLAAAGAAALLSSTAQAASHSDAPLSLQDPLTNITDVYAFIGNNNAGAKVLNVVVTVRPFLEPGDGVIYPRFADNALYSIHITNPTTGAIARSYNFRFSDVNPLTLPGLKNPNTILSYGRGTEIGPIMNVGDARQNYTQFYGVNLSTGSNGAGTPLQEIGGNSLMVPPPNVGRKTTPFYNASDTGRAISGATSFAGLDKYTQQTVYNLSSGETVFAGTREDGFFGDTPAIFDLLQERILGNSNGQNGGGFDSFSGFNVLTYSIQIPVANLPSFSYTTPALIGGTQTGVGVFASVSRPRVTLRRTNAEPFESGPFIQVNRMGNPLFNEVLVALQEKDVYLRTLPGGDNSFAEYALQPEVAVLINAVFGTNIQTTNRTDLAAIFLGSQQQADVLRVNTTTDAVPLPGQGGFSRLSFVGGDTTGGVPSGWPNGRRLGDDVIDIALTAVASGPTYETITVLGDNVISNDQVYHQVFPYAATPHAGPDHEHHAPTP